MLLDGRPVLLELLGDVQVGDRHHQVDGVHVAVDGVVYVAFYDPRKTADLGPQAFFHDGPDAIPLSLRRDGRAGLDNVDAQGIEILCDPNLFLRLQAYARGLFAVSQSGVKESDITE